MVKYRLPYFFLVSTCMLGRVSVAPLLVEFLPVCCKVTYSFHNAALFFQDTVDVNVE